jgi:endoglucanase
MASSRHARRPGAFALVALLALLTACAGDGSLGVGPGADDTGRSGNSGVSTPSDAGVNVLAGSALWVDGTSNARRSADAWRASRPSDAAQLDKIASQSQVRWFGNWNVDVARDANAATATMTAAGSLPVFVAYNIPQRDCGGLSGGNTTTAAGYRIWIAALAEGIGARRAAVILEPDALAGMGCLSPADQQQRLDLIGFAVQTLRAKGAIAVYLDAGNPAWQSAATMADRLSRAGLAAAQGFALNVSNFLPTADNIAYGRQISALAGGKHFVIDTGRNGAGGNGQWCNPAGRALGERPTTSTGQPLVDAYLWVKAPGESDGACNGGQASGEWMPEYALGLAQRAAY